MKNGLAPLDRGKAARLILAFQIGVAFIFAILLVSFWNFQVAQHAKFLRLAENNHRRTLDLRASRGIVFDRDGRVLVENRYSLNISIIREQVEDLDRSLLLLARVTGTDKAVLRAAVDQHDDGFDYRPVVVIADASLAQVAAVAGHALELPAVVVEQIPTRYYPAERVAAHLFGYVGEISDNQLEQEEFGGLESGAIVGQSGVEQAYNQLLMGEDGARQVVVNSVGREIETIGERPPRQGRQVQLTIDYDLQKATEEAFNVAGYAGAAVVLDPRSGEVLSLVSLPAYDPNAFALGIDTRTWASLNTDDRKPLQNRPLQGRYAPGSTFKVVMAAAALEEGVVTPDFKVSCAGGGNFYGRFFRCHERHGTVTLEEAIEKSCNTYFYTLGSMLDIDVIHKWATAFGLGELSGIDLPHEVQGLVPSTAWKREATGQPWYPGETISVAIGQGQVSVTPLSLAVMIATVANGDRRVVPHLLRAENSGNGWVTADPPVPTPVELQPETVETLQRALWLVVNREGTGRRSRIRGRDVIGKTGTAQVISLEGRAAAGETNQELRDHGWFVFAAPMDKPEIAGVVFAEHSEHGYLAAPIARHIIESYFSKQNGRPGPTLPLRSRPLDVAIMAGNLP